MEKISYLNQPNCYRLSNGTVETIVTTDIGPRVVRYGFIDGENIFGEFPDLATATEWGEWKPWGGHRLWAAPEAMPRSYAPDNAPVEFHFEGEHSIRLVQSIDKSVIQKEMLVTLAKTGARVDVRHKITNRTLWDIELAPWAITILRGGETILPLAPYRSHDEYLLPAQVLTRWYFTDLTDSRWRIGKKYIRLQPDENLDEPQKIGILNKQGWCAYHLAGTLFIKRFDYSAGACCPDYNSNNEAYAAGSYMEIESLGALQRLAPNESAEHAESWFLFQNVNLGKTEASIDAALNLLVAQTIS